MIITKVEDFNVAFFKILGMMPKKVKILTYGLYAGILDNGKDINSWKQTGTKLILDEIKEFNINCEIIVGIPEYISCKERIDCDDCIIKHNKLVERIKKTAELYSSIKWHFVDRMHIKGYIFEFEDKDIALLGSRNFSDSGYEEAIIKIKPADASHLKEMFKDTRDRAVSLSKIDSFKINRNL